MGSVTKFGEIVKIIVHFWRIYLVFGKTLIALWRNFFAKEANFHGQKWKIQFIWSHCHWVVIVQAISTLSVEVVVRERADGSPGLALPVPSLLLWSLSVASRISPGSWDHTMSNSVTAAGLAPLNWHPVSLLEVSPWQQLAVVSADSVQAISDSDTFLSFSLSYR